MQSKRPVSVAPSVFSTTVTSGKRSSAFTSSDTLIFTLLLLDLFKEIQNANKIPRTNRILKDLVSLYIKRSMTGNKLLPISNMQQFIDFIASTISKLPPDMKNELLSRQDASIKVLNERIDIRTTLLEGFNHAVQESNNDMKNIVKIVAPQPDAQVGNVVLTNQIKTINTNLNSIDGKFVRENMQITLAEQKTVELANLCARSIGVPLPRAEEAPFVPPLPRSSSH